MYIYGWCGSRGECYGAREWAGASSANGGRFEIKQLLFADDTALVADLEEKLCRLVKLVENGSMRNKKVESECR